MPDRRRLLHEDRGSIPLALLVIMIMAGLTSVVYARTAAEQRSVRFDTEFTTVLHAAETGLQEAMYRINNHLAVTGSAAGSGASNGYAYTWTATRAAEGPWTVTTTGTGPDGVARTIVAELSDRPLFDVSLATHLGINFAGGNKAGSYNSRTQTRCSPPSKVSCFGIVASNGDIDMGSSGSSTNYADRVRVHDWANPANRGSTRCSPANSQFCVAPFRENVDEPLDIQVAVPLVQHALDTSCPSFPSWRASDHATGSGANRQAVFQPTQTVTHQELGRVACFSQLVFDEHTVLPATATADNGYAIIVRDHIKVEGGVRINCPQCGSGFPAAPNRPAARRLQIFTLAEDQSAGTNNVLAAVQVRQHAKISAAIYAPNASCGNQQSNAQVEIYGSLICKTVLNQGGWEFHYDEDLLGGLTTGVYLLDRWREE